MFRIINISYCRYFSIIGHSSFSFCSTKNSVWHGLATVPIFLPLTVGNLSISLGKLILSLLLFPFRFRTSLDLFIISVVSPIPELWSDCTRLFVLFCSKILTWLLCSNFIFNFDSCGGTERSDIKRCGQLKDLWRLNLFAENDCWFTFLDRWIKNRSNVWPNTF